MFTGIIEELGVVKAISCDSILVECNKILSDIHVGDSIAVDGVCLTVTEFSSNTFRADISVETMKVTKLGSLKLQDQVNLERAMLATSRFGGHIVSGHIDCVGEISKLNKNGEFFDINIKLPSKNYCNYIIKKGSITIDGISLTIYDLTLETVCIAIIPHTFEHTNLKTLKVGSFVNIEFDILAKYIEKNLLMNDNKSNITESFLKDHGFV